MNLRPLKTWYEKMLPRERLMLIAFLGVMVLMWLGVLANQAKAMKADVTATKAKLTEQDNWLGKESSIKSELDGLTVKFQNSLNPNELYDTVQNLLSEDKELPATSHTVTQEATHKQKIFNVNSVSVNIKAVPLPNLIEFTQKIRKMSPLLSFQNFTVTAEATNPTIYSVKMVINSLELSPASSGSTTAATATKK